MSTETAFEQRELGPSGGTARSVNSARLGFIPIPLAHVPASLLNDISVFLRAENVTLESEAFTLYRAEGITFTDADRSRLLEHGVKFVYIRMAEQKRFRERSEARLQEVACDPTVAVSESSALIYETSVALIDELLAEPDLAAHSLRLENIARSITTLVINSPAAFSHLFSASHHDFYTATHLVNVSTWMVPLAYALGYHDLSELNQICQAGLLHDIGKVYVSEDTLNKQGKLLDDEWAVLQRHPELGLNHLQQYDGIPEVVKTVAVQHHERMDGSGYPGGLAGDRIDPISRMCAVVDSFDAMTAFRPFKRRTLSVGQAIDILKSETPAKYDPKVLEAWLSLLGTAATGQEGVSAQPEAKAPSQPRHRRRYSRVRFQCAARVHLLDNTADGWHARPGMAVVAHNVSRGGVGVLSQTSIETGQRVRVYLESRVWSREYVDCLCVRCRVHRDGWFEIGLQVTELGPARESPPAAADAV